MPSLEASLSRFRPRLVELVQQHVAPAVSFAIGRGDDVFTAAAGIANLNTGAPATTETKFLIGSNTKALTISLFCRAAEQGLVSLDERVRTYLPDFRTADEATTNNVTVRQILLHTNGIHGDFAGSPFFPYRDFGRGDDAIANLVAALPEAGIAHPLGMTWSYSNAAYVVAGRILEVLHGKPYAMILREQLLEPLGMVETALTPEESILGSVAVGHESGEAGGLRVTGRYLLPPALAPAGSIVNSTARDLLRFGRMFVDRGKTATGERYLQETTIEEMLRPAVPIPMPLQDVHMCLSMILDEGVPYRLYRSSGGTTGQSSLLHLLPDHDLALVALGNGPGCTAASTTLFDEVIQELTGIEPRGKPDEPPSPADMDLNPYVGRYETLGLTATVEQSDGHLDVTITSTGPAPHGEPQRLRFRPIGGHDFVIPGAGTGGACTFLDVTRGKAGYLWMRTAWRRAE